MSNPTALVQKLWNYCNILRDDGLSYGDYVEQLTFLLFLKMADERAALTGEPQAIPAGFRWLNLANPKMEGVKLEQHYRDTLRKLGEQGGMLGLIFSKAQNKIQDPAKLRKLVVDLIGNESWLEMSADVKGDAYEGLLERNAQDTKSGAGQYFTPRSLIDALVDERGRLCALHRGDSFIRPEPFVASTRTMRYRWNGFGFSKRSG